MRTISKRREMTDPGESKGESSRGCVAGPVLRHGCSRKLPARSSADFEFQVLVAAALAVDKVHTLAGRPIERRLE